LTARENQDVNGYFMCDIGRYGFHRFEDIDRVIQPMVRNGQSFDVLDWDEAIQKTAELIEKYGEDKLYKGGLTVRTSLNPRLQKIADNVLKSGLVNYDLRHGWRGPLANVNIKDTNLKRDLANIAIPEAFPNWKAAAVIHIDGTGVNIFFDNENYGRINLKDLKWARQWRKNQYLGPPIKIQKMF